MSIESIGMIAQDIQVNRGPEAAQPSPTAADFAAMMRKLAGPEMLWEEQAPEAVPENAAGDDTDARGVLASGRRLRQG